MRSAAVPRFSSKIPGFISYVILREKVAVSTLLLLIHHLMGRSHFNRDRQYQIQTQ